MGDMRRFLQCVLLASVFAMATSDLTIEEEADLANQELEKKTDEMAHLDLTVEKHLALEEGVETTLDVTVEKNSDETTLDVTVEKKADETTLDLSVEKKADETTHDLSNEKKADETIVDIAFEKNSDEIPDLAMEEKSDETTLDISTEKKSDEKTKAWDHAMWADVTALEDDLEKAEDDVDISDEARLFLHGTCRCDRHETQKGLCYIGKDNSTMEEEVAEEDQQVYGRNGCHKGYYPKCGKIAFICYCLCKQEMLPLRPEKPLRPEDTHHETTEETGDSSLQDKVDALEEEVEDLQGEVDGLKEQVKEDQEEIEHLEDKVEENEEDIEEIHEEVEDHHEDAEEADAHAHARHHEEDQEEHHDDAEEEKHDEEHHAHDEE